MSSAGPSEERLTGTTLQDTKRVVEGDDTSAKRARVKWLCECATTDSHSLTKTKGNAKRYSKVDCLRCMLRGESGAAELSKKYSASRAHLRTSPHPYTTGIVMVATRSWFPRPVVNWLRSELTMAKLGAPASSKQPFRLAKAKYLAKWSSTKCGKEMPWEAAKS